MRKLLYSQLYSVKEDFASNCGSRRSLKQPGWAFLGGLHEDKDIMSEMADFQEMSEVSSKPEKMWFNGWVWNLGSHSLTKLLQTTVGQTGKVHDIKILGGGVQLWNADV